ncbi:class II aldolase/adducin family protein [Schaalia suimastitidis]|uniref:class II aldolase/adducin family protein n=1 Tax=Schaalia suimastitidis TaxID=121163 RepID=UPI00042782B9|nr:class II aldolase/adducin family protein [Schaalia suimastitidis]
MPQDSLTSELIRLANEIGGDPEFSRAGGGNASVKIDGILHIKPSGVPLATLDADDLVPLKIDVLLAALHSDEEFDGDPVRIAAQRAQVGDAGGRRPSVEILFHALLEQPLVLHLHPLTANAITCNTHGRELTAQILGDEAIWVDYLDPGIPLARGIETAIEAHKQRTGKATPGLVMLGNHGIIASGNSYDEVAQRIFSATAAIRATIDEAPHPAPFTADPLEPGRATAVAKHLKEVLEVDSIAINTHTPTLALAHPTATPLVDGPLIPDQIVYAGSLPLILPADASADEIANAMSTYRETHGRCPIVAVIPGRAIFAAGNSEASATNALATFTDALRVAADASRLGTCRAMDMRERHFIENWEAEAYRKHVAAQG